METTMELPEHVTICEVGTRDGFQIEPDFVSTEAKIEVVNLLSDAGVPRIEVTSFVHPKVVPQMRDAEEVIAKIRRRPARATRRWCRTTRVRCVRWTRAWTRSTRSSRRARATI